MFVHHLASVNGELVRDLDPDAVTTTAGPLRLDDAVTAERGGLLARSATYTAASFGARTGGGAVTVRPRLLDARVDTLGRLAAELRELAVDHAPEPDLGTTLTELVHHGLVGPDTALASVPDPAAAVAHGVAAAAAGWLGDVDGRTVAIEGFGEVGAALADVFADRGARVIAVSTDRGAVAAAAGLELATLVEARAAHGARFVHELGLEVHRPAELHGLVVDVLVPGAPIGVLDATVAATVQAQVVVPAARVPYTAAGLAALRVAGIPALPDFVSAAGANVAALAPPGLTPAEVRARIDREIGERVAECRRAKVDPTTYFTLLADTFLATWVPDDLLPPGPAPAPEPLGGRW